MITPWIVSVGARCSVGLNALQVAACMRADLVEPRASTFKDGRGRAVGMCRVGGLGSALVGYERLMQLALPALREAVDGVTGEGWPLLVALPAAERPDYEERFQTVAQELARKGGSVLDAEKAEVVLTGHAGGIEVLRRAAEMLAAGASGVVVGGVDSFHHPEVVRWLDEAYRLHALDVDGGFIPGEAAAFLVLRPKQQAGARARLLYAEVRDEPAMLTPERPLIAEAMTALFKDSNGTAAPWVMNDVSNEYQRRRQWRFVSFRHDLSAAVVHYLPEKVGDVGAASAPLMAATAFSWWSLGCAPASKVWLASSSDAAGRGVAVLEEVPQ